MTQAIGSPELVVRGTAHESARVIAFRDTYLNYERTDVLKPRLQGLIAKEMAAGCRRVLLDMGNLGVIDSCGLAILVSADKQVRLGGGTLALVGLSEMIQRLLDLTGLDRIFEIHPSVEAALVGTAA